MPFGGRPYGAGDETVTLPSAGDPGSGATAGQGAGGDVIVNVPPDPVVVAGAESVNVPVNGGLHIYDQQRCFANIFNDGYIVVENLTYVTVQWYENGTTIVNNTITML